MRKRNKLLRGILIPLTFIFLSFSEVAGDDFLHFMGEDIHHMFSTEPLAVTGIGAAAAACAFILEDNGYNGVFPGDGCLRTCSNVCDKAFGLPLLGVSSITWGIGALSTSRDAEETGQMLTEGLLLTYSITGAVKFASGRTTPDGSNSRSFPSGHSSGTACAAVILWDRYGAGAGIPAAAVAAFTAFSRLILEKHYPSDIITGAAIGLSVGLAVAGAHEDDAGSSRQIQPAPGITWSSSGGFGVYF
jgi:hypothetical protein